MQAVSDQGRILRTEVLHLKYNKLLCNTVYASAELPSKASIWRSLRTRVEGVVGVERAYRHPRLNHQVIFGLALLAVEERVL